MGALAGKKAAGRLSIDDYLSFLGARPHGEHWQLIDGVAVMMNPPSLAHQVIGTNLVQRLNVALQRSRPELFAVYEVGVRIEGHESFFPEVDVAVVDKPVDYSNFAQRFYLTAEILSESNTSEFISLKVQRYGEHPDNLYSLIVAQREVMVEVWSRASGWKGAVLRTLDDTIDLPEFGFHCTLRDLYRGTPLA